MIIKLYRMLLIVLYLSMLLHGVSHANSLTKDTVWEGEIKVTDDILVPKGITLTIRPGTVVKFVSAESTKTDPEYISPLTEITIRGTLIVEGSKDRPVFFSGEEDRVGSWAGIVIDQGNAAMQFVRIRNAETAVHVLDGGLKIQNGILRDSRYGLTIQGGKTDAFIEDTAITFNDYGIFTLQGARLFSKSSTIQGNRKKDSFTAQIKNYDSGVKLDAQQSLPISRSYKDAVFRGDVVWQGRIEVDGIIRVPQGSRLIVMPGTIVEFSKRDTNGDGIGENGILIQGLIIAKGTRELPIVFRSSETGKQMGDWDSINIMNSAGAQNLIEHCRIEQAYRGLHFHFSNVALHNSYFTNNYRGIQFQESQVYMKGNYLFANKSGVQGRDSDLAFFNNVLQNNYVGANFFRTTLVASGNRVVGNWKEGWRIREGVSTLQENLIDGNRQGLLLADMFYGSYNRNSFTNNMETGLALKNADNIEVTGNVIASNGINGLNIQDTRALIKGNMITDNAEKGIGIQSFSGLITENNLASNGRYAIDLDGTSNVSAPSNWWGGDSPARMILDKLVDSSRGRVLYEKSSPSPFRFVWPMPGISTDTVWRGAISINNDTTVMMGAELIIAPKTVVEFEKNTGLLITGRIIAAGKPDEKIIFTSSEKKAASEWDEIRLEYATGSVISNCIFEYATWGLHSHFTNLTVSDSRFTNNHGGMRFRSGPVVVKNSTFDNNAIGIRSYIGNAVIRGNTIRNNEVGIFVREKGGGLVVKGNNFTDNSSYAIRVGDFNTENVNAQDNWWGGVNPASVIFDDADEPGIGRVLLDPVLAEPVTVGERAVQ